MGDRGEADAIRIEVWPEPSDEEAAALVAALVMLPAERAEPELPVAPVPSRWVMAGRRVARAGLAGGAPVGWGRNRR